MPRKRIGLTRFCDPSHNMRSHRAPFVLGAYKYATDGRIIVRVKKSKGEKDTPNISIDPARKTIWRPLGKKRWREIVAERSSFPNLWLIEGVRIHYDDFFRIVELPNVRVVGFAGSRFPVLRFTFDGGEGVVAGWES